MRLVDLSLVGQCQGAAHEPREIRHGGLIDAIAAQDVEAAGREAGGFLDELIEELPS